MLILLSYLIYFVKSFILCDITLEFLAVLCTVGLFKYLFSFVFNLGGCSKND